MLDILCIAPHPDDAELICGGLLLKAKKTRLKFGIADCTQGEMGTRGTVAQRKKESAAADRLLGTAVRVNLGLKDGHVMDDEAKLRVKLVQVLRKFRPKIVLAPYWEDQHPDHAAVGRVIEHAAWLCGAPKYDPKSAKDVAAHDRLPYRPKLVLYYNNRYQIVPDLIFDISAEMKQKLELVKCYQTQFGPGAKGAGPQTKLSSEKFFPFFEALHSNFGNRIGVAYGEAYCVKGPLPVLGLGIFNDLFS
jgi:bacillithiol biosynthesis deacetylase BshB1